MSDLVGQTHIRQCVLLSKQSTSICLDHNVGRGERWWEVVGRSVGKREEVDGICVGKRCREESLNDYQTCLKHLVPTLDYCRYAFV